VTNTDTCHQKTSKISISGYRIIVENQRY